jgi:hypothetical protein
MTHKIIFTAPFYHTYRAQPLRLLSVSHRGVKKQVVVPVQPTSSHTISHRSSTPFPMAEKKERKIEKHNLKDKR